jgi:uncharacterized protein YuzE
MTKNNKSWNKSKKVTMRETWDNKIDILNFYWGNKTVHSRELDIHVIADFDKNDNIVGLEIWDFGKALKESQKKIDEIFKRHSQND